MMESVRIFYDRSLPSKDQNWRVATSLWLKISHIYIVDLYMSRFDACVVSFLVKLSRMLSIGCLSNDIRSPVFLILWLGLRLILVSKQFTRR